MPEATDNSAIEDGSGGASPPASDSSAGGDTRGSESPPTESTQSGAVAVSERAPGNQSQADPMDEVYDRLQASAEGRTMPQDRASPSKAEDTLGEATERRSDEATEGGDAEGKGKSDAAKTDAARRTREYQGLEADGRNLLKNAGLLVPAETWNSWSESVRNNTLEAAREFRAEHERLYQREQRVGQGNQNPNQPRQPQQNPGNQPNQQNPGTQQQGTTQSTPEVEQIIGQVHNVWGKELSEPLRAITQQLTNSHQRQIAQREQQMVGQLNAAFAERDNTIAYLLKRLENTEEKAGFAQFEKQLASVPQFKDKQVRGEIVKRARAFLRAHWGDEGNSPSDYSYEQAVVDAIGARFYANIQQQAQLGLAQDRTRSLRGTSERPTAINQPKAARKPSEDEDMDRVYDQLARGSA